MRFWLLAIPVLALGLVVWATRQQSDYLLTLYRLEPSNPDRYTPGQPQFDLGQVIMTAGVQDLLTGEDDRQRLRNIITHHREGDWGAVGSATQSRNDSAVEEGERIMGIHTLAGQRIYVITAWDRSVTTALLPEEY